MDDTPLPPGDGNGGDGGGEGRGTPRAFAAGYRAHSGDLMVYGGGALTLIGVLATVVQGTPVFLVASLVGTLSALYFQPTIDLKTPQLGANQHGIYLARIGFIPWEEITEIRVEHRALRTMRLATLIVRTGRPLAEAVSEPDRVSVLARFTARNARVSHNGTIRAPLHTLSMDPPVIETRLRALYAASRL
ncbi:MAG: hypothetical protein AcusKO_34670 [Acuticoccus sp.]